MGKLLCYDKRTNKVVPDFQSEATPGTLIKNAVNAGRGVESDFEEREATKQEFEAALTAFKEEVRPEREAKEKVRSDAFKSLKKKLKDLGLTKEEIDLLVPYAS